MNTKVTRLVVFIISSYIAAQMLSDIASLKIGVVFGLSVDMGTFIYPITFTLRDVAHKIMGKKNVQILVLCAAFINVFMVVYLMWSSFIPSDPSWGLDSEFSLIFSPMWRIVIASIVAEVLSELLDTEVYSFWVTRVTKKYQWMRVVVSNSFSIPVDNIIFSVGAFALILPWDVVFQIFLLNMVVKFGMMLISIPLIYVSSVDEI